MDVRSATSLHLVPQLLKKLQSQGIAVKSLFLESTTGTLVRRYSETRRKHPLSQSEPDGSAKDFRRALVDVIELERELLADLRENAHVIDSSLIRPSQLQGYVKSVISSRSDQLTLVFESFAFKRGVPGDADYVFDVRMLPNPHYDADLRALTGRDEPVAKFLQDQPDVGRMYGHIEHFLNEWLPLMAADHRSYVTVAIGCTGGQHRSVYLVERLSAGFGDKWVTLKRHRELDALDGVLQAG
jgi:RNase adapter protein RapZ